MGVGLLPQFTKDTTDRNRTSPFAFTGNKFEFRAVGSSFNISTSIMVINTIVADSMNMISARIKKEAKSSNFEAGVLKILADVIKGSKKILFEGNNYSEEWKKEAAKRGLGNEPSTPEALKALITKANMDLFEKHGVLSKREIQARYHIWIEMYNKLLTIEARTLSDMVNTLIVPATIGYQTELGLNLETLARITESKLVKLDSEILDERKEMFSMLTQNIHYTVKHLKEMHTKLETAHKMSEDAMAGFFFNDLKPLMEHIRQHVDEIEKEMPDSKWELPKYKEMLFIA